MDFISNSPLQNQEMLATIGIKSVEELFCAIPDSLLIQAPQHDDGMSEYEGMRLMEALAAKNTFPTYDNYLGAGAYEHHVPALVGAICSKSEFLTAYTPYQPEASQGTLQSIFEFQSAICALTGLDVANASLYDGASACAEAILMALRCQKNRNKVVIAENVHPHYRAVIEQYLQGQGVTSISAPISSDGQLDLDVCCSLIDQDTAAVLVQYPSFLGTIDAVGTVCSKAKEMNALSIVCANPLVYGLYASAAELAADIAVGDCQPFGLPLQFGGPYVGYIACRRELVRQLPGRVVGQTVDTEGRRGFVLTLQAREQHIRREKATSNICTNQALAALASLIGMLWYGKEGVYKLALTNYQRAAYLRGHLESTICSPLSQAPFLNEFAVKWKVPIENVQAHFRAKGIEPGLDLGRFYPHLQNCMLITVTETKSKQQLDRYCEVVKSLKN
jgi:glycine dehydrogenase subunit 1